MKNKFLIIFSILYLGTSIPNFGQKATISISEKLEIKGTEMIDKHLMTTAAGNHFVRTYKVNGFFSKDINYIINQYDEKFNLKESNEFISAKDKVYIADIVKVKDQIFLLTKEKNSKEDYIQYDYIPVDANGKNGNPINLGKFKYERKKDEPDIISFIAGDTSKVGFVSYVDNNKKDETFYLFTSVTSSSKELLWNKKVSLKKPQENIEIISSAVTNDGQVYILFKEYEGKKAKESKRSKKSKNKTLDKPAYTIKLIKIQDSENAYDETILDLKDVFLVNADIKIMPNGDLGVIGLFSTTKKLLINGVLSLKINIKTDEIYNVSKKEFSSETIDALGDEKNTNKYKGEEGLSGRFKLIDLTYLEDGSSYVTMEENYSYTVAHRNGNSFTYTTYYVSKDIIVIKLSALGEISNVNIIPKRQKFTTDIYNSTVVVANENGYHCIYNEDEDNLKKDNKRKRYISSLKDCVATMTIIDNNGKITREALFDRDDTKAVLMPNLSNKISANEVFFIAGKMSFFSSNDFRIGTIKIE